MSRAAEDANADQRAYWTTNAGPRWLEFERSLDRLLEPVGAHLVAHAVPAPGDAVLDVGCGTGATTIELAAKVGRHGRVVGIDIAEPFLARARERARAAGADRVEFLSADAQTYPFVPASFDLVQSRFGVMFFADPVAAFANLRKASRPEGRCCFASWAGIDQNPWFKIPRDAAVARLGKPSAVSPTAPGPMAFADRAYVLDILEKAGWKQPRGEATTVLLEYDGQIADLARLAISIGPAVRVMNELQGGPDDAAAIAAETARALAAFWTKDGARIPAAINRFTAAVS